MSLLIRKPHHTRIFTGIKKLALILFLTSLSMAFIDTIWAVYLDEFFHSDSLVGFFSGFLSVLSFICFFALVPIIERSNKAKLYSTLLILFVVSYLILALNHNLWVLIIISILTTIFVSLKIMAFGLIIRDNSNNKALAKNEGVIYTFSNIAWLIGPLIAGFVSYQLGIPSIFFISASLFLVSFLLFRVFKVKDNNYVRKVDSDILKNFLNFFKSKERVKAYLLGGGVNLWWALIYLYMPLYIINNGLNEEWIGLFLFGVALPLISLEYYFAKFAGKKGFRKVFFWGYTIPAVVAVICFFAGNIYVILGLLILASVGIAMIEPTTEAYFFDILKNKKEENEFYGPYNTAIETGLIIGKIIPAALLLFLPFKYIFLLFGLLMFLLMLLSLRTKKIIESKR